MNDYTIDIVTDFISYKSQATGIYGEQNYQQAELFFQRAIAQAEQGNKLEVISYVKFALNITHYSVNADALNCIIGSISPLHCKLGELEKSFEYHSLDMTKFRIK